VTQDHPRGLFLRHFEIVALRSGRSPGLLMQTQAAIHLNRCCAVARTSRVALVLWRGAWLLIQPT
jgi:hypothetical protein